MTREGFVFPLSFAQQRLWFIEQLEAGTGAYNLPVAHRLRGSVNLRALEQSLNEIVRRHEVLRTTFSFMDGDSVQIIASALTLRVPFVDLRHLSPEQVTAFVSKESRAPFDLSRGPLIRANLLKLGEEEHILLIVLHHIVADAWSVGVLLRELSVFYESSLQEGLAALPDLAVQYADFAVWQREWLQGAVLQKQLSYWKEKLQNAPAVLQLPADRRRPAVQTYSGARRSLFVSKTISEPIKVIGRREGATLFMMMLSAFKILLFRYSGQTDMVVGTPIAGRNKTELEPLIGFFVNTLVLRTDLTGNPKFTALLRRVRESALEAYEHQDLPFEKLVEELQPQRDFSHSPFFQVMFQVLHYSNKSLSLPGIRNERFEFDTGIAKFDLALDVLEKPEGMSCVFRYNVDLFDDTTIRRMSEHFASLLEGIAQNPEERISALPLLTSGERQQRLRPREAAPTAKQPDSQTICRLFELQTQRTPEAIAVVYATEKLTYRELNVRANRLARFLIQQGVGPEILVGICIERSIEMIVGILAILKAGGAYVPLDPEYPEVRLDYIIDQSKISHLVTNERWLTRCPKFTGPTICLDRDAALFEREEEENPNVGLDPDNLAYVIYTSGSTGNPKGVLGFHRAVTNYFSYLAQTYNLNAADVVLQIPSLSFDASIRDLLGPLAAGAQVVMMNDLQAREPVALLSCIKQHGVTCILSVVPTLLNELLAAATDEDRLGDSVRLVLVSGEALLKAVCLKARHMLGSNALVVNQYGPTECTLTSSYYIIDEWETDWDIAPLGRPIPNARMFLLDGYLDLVPTGVPGEIHIGGAGLTRGYSNSPELTAERFIPDPFSAEPGARLYRTGDVGRYRHDGDIDYLGRIDHQVKMRGFRIELGEIEASIREHPSVKEAAVAAVNDSLDNKCLAAYIVPLGTRDLDRAEIARFLKARLPHYMIPAFFVFMDKIPLSPNGKIDRRALPDPALANPRPGKLKAAPQTPAEIAVAEVWRGVLGVKDLSIDDDFFELGGHSLQATRVVSRLRGKFAVELPLRRLFESSTVAGLARCIEEELGSNGKQQTLPPSPLPRPDQVPLSFAQERLWFLEQLDPLSPVYNVSAAFRLTGALNPAALEESLNEVVRRHEVLRTFFSSIEGRPVQAIGPLYRLAFPIWDLSSVRGAERESEALRLATEEARRPFDLTQPPLLRSGLLRLGEQEHVLLLTMHHIISDGWSLEIFLRELSALYRAFSQQKPSPLPDLPLQYADFALWQRQWLQGEILEKQLSYWKQQLNGAPSLLELPNDRPRPAVQTFRGAKQSVALPRVLTESLKALSCKQGVTLFMTLLAAFQAMLRRYTGQEDIVVGAPIANRNRREVEGLIGFFANTLALRTDLSGNPTFRELLGRVREVALGAYAHQDLPFERLVQELQPERDLSRNPLFQVMFSLQQDLISRLEFSGLSFEPLKLERGVARFDLSLAMIEGEKGLRAVLEYNTDLFDEASVTRMLGRWQTLLEGIVAEPDKRLSDLPILTERERHQLLVEWNDTEKDYAKDKCVHQLFESQVDRTPDAIAVVFEEEQLTYWELNRRGNQLAHYLQSLGVGPEVLVGICMERSPEMVVGLLGILKTGGAYVPLDPGYPKERLAFMLEDARVSVLLTERHLVERLPEHEARVVCLDKDWETISHEREDNLSVGVTGENLAYVIYTSGSTGQPKGVMVRHVGLCNVSEVQSRLFEVETGSRVLQFSSLGFDASIFEIVMALLKGATLCLGTQESLLPGPGLIRLMQQHAITIVTFPPSVLASLPVERLPALRTVTVAGESCPAELCAEWVVGHRFFNLYGPTESTIWVTAAECADSSRKPPIGRPIANTKVYLLDRDLRPVLLGVPGELHINGVGLARGYLNRPDLTAERFIPDSFSAEPGARLYKTGDLARYLPDGNIEFLCRIDRQVKIRGFRIELGEIEAVLTQHPVVRETVVLAREDVPGDKRLAAYIVPKENQPTTASDLRGFLKQKLPDYMIPSAFMVLDSLPLTPNGKVDRQALPVPSHSRSNLGRDFLAPYTPTEKALAEIWRDSLKLEQIGVHDNFFDLGGHSINAMAVASKISARMKLDFPVKLLFEYPTIAALATVVDLSRSTYVPVPARGLQPDVARNVMGYPSSGRELELVEIERRPLLSLIAAGKIPPVDAAALSYLSEESLRRIGLTPEAALVDWCDNLPCVNWIVETSLGRIAIVMLPRFRSELYNDKEDLVKVVCEALKISRQIGARTASLMGLLPSATEYGHAIVKEISEPNGLPVITTGHSTTVTAVVLAIRRVLLESGRDLAQEDVAFLGMGSIGRASLRLMLRYLPHPKKLLICDVYGKLDWLQKIRDEIVTELKFKGCIQIVGSSRKPPPEIYAAGLIVGATNVPDLLEIESLLPGTLIVDDSAPHCFNARHAIERFKKSEDILFTEGGALQLPSRIRRMRYVPSRVERMMDPEALESFSKLHPFHIAGCAFSSLLLARFDNLKPTLGLVDDDSSAAHYETIRNLGYEAARLHCEDYLLPERSIENFRKRFGCR